MDDDHTLDLCRHLLATLTGMLEDAAAFATTGQGAVTIVAAHGATVTLRDALARCAAVTDAVLAIARA